MTITAMMRESIICHAQRRHDTLKTLLRQSSVSVQDRDCAIDVHDLLSTQAHRAANPLAVWKSQLLWRHSLTAFANSHACLEEDQLFSEELWPCGPVHVLRESFAQRVCEVGLPHPHWQGRQREKGAAACTHHEHSHIL